MTDLHAEIMNIQCDTNDECTYKYGQEHHHTSYKVGHRDARHAAAELSLKADARIEELEAILERFVTWQTDEEGKASLLDDDELWLKAEEVLNNK